MDLDLARKGALTFGASSGSGPVHVVSEEGTRSGYEPAVAAALARQLGLEPRWETIDWEDLYPALQAGRVDALLYNQGVTTAREEQADFTHPYGLFHESILVRENSEIRAAADLRGRRLAALSETTNMKLAEAIDGAEIVGFPASVEGFEAMLEALRSGDVEALVDDEIFLKQFESQGYEIAFTVRTQNPYAIAVRKGDALRGALDGALDEIIAGGELERIWAETIAGVPFERPSRQRERTVEDLRAQILDDASN